MSLAGILVLVLAFVFAMQGVRWVAPWEKGVVERLGKVHRVVGPGLAFIMPFTDRIVRVDMREQSRAIPRGDGELLVTYRVEDPVKLLARPESFPLALDEAVRSREACLETMAGEWGVRIARVESREAQERRS